MEGETEPGTRQLAPDERSSGMTAFRILRPFIDDVRVGALLASVGGIMVFISFDELLPTAREYSKGHEVIIGIVAGMAVMAVSLLLL